MNEHGKERFAPSRVGPPNDDAAITGERYWLDWAWSVLKSVRPPLTSLVGKFSLIATCLLVAAVCWTEWKATSAIIDDFEISPGLSSNGITPSVVAHVLDRKLREIHDVAGTSMRINSLSVGEVPEYTIPGTGISLNYLMSQFRRFVGGDQVRISGSILTLDNQIQTIVRIEKLGDAGGTFEREIAETSIDSCGSNKFGLDHAHLLSVLDAHLSCAAEFVLRNTQPYILATYYKEVGDVAAAKDLLRYTMFHSEMGEGYWALNLMGSMAREEAAIEPSARDVLRNEARAYFDRADKTFTEMKKRNSNLVFPLTHVNRGLLFEDQGRLDDAQREYETAIKEDKAFGLAYSALADLIVTEANSVFATPNDRDRLWKVAQDRYQQGIDNSRDGYSSALIWTNWARSLSNRGDYAAAQDKILSAIAADATFAPAYFLNGQVLGKISNSNRLAILYAFAAAARLNPWNTDYVVQYARSLREGGNVEGAIVQFESAMKSDPDNVHNRLEYARALGQTIGNNPDRYKMAFDQYYQVYDNLMKSNRADTAMTDQVKNELFDLVRLSVSAPVTSGGAGNVAAQASSQAAAFVQAGDRFLGAGYFSFADTFYSEGAQSALAADGEKASEALKDEIVKRLLTALARAASLDERIELIELARNYRPNDEKILVQNFLILAAGSRLDLAEKLAQQECSSDKKILDDTARRWIPSWQCPS